ncbi:MAG TPA: hypothetical protein VK386_06605 [Acidimicrobiales bacterium]|nr:hypothetical protein [Acidimicrobiales bacterium]
MGLMDKLKEQAGQVAAQAQKGAAQAQAKFEAVQGKRSADVMLRDLGAACYSEQRQGGSHDAVEKALAALDSYVAGGGTVDVSTTGPQSGPSQAAPASGAAPAGDFKLD